MITSNQKYYRAHKQKAKDATYTWRKNNPNKQRQIRYRANQKLKVAALGAYSQTAQPSCSRCGIDDLDVLCLDHINDNGKEDRKITGMGSNFYNWLKQHNYPEGYQVLCRNCNYKKELERRRKIMEEHNV